MMRHPGPKGDKQQGTHVVEMATGYFHTHAINSSIEGHHLHAMHDVEMAASKQQQALLQVKKGGSVSSKSINRLVHEVGPLVVDQGMLKEDLSSASGQSSLSCEAPICDESSMQTNIPVARIFSSLFSQLDITAISVAFGESMARSSELTQLESHSAGVVKLGDTLNPISLGTTRNN